MGLARLRLAATRWASRKAAVHCRRPRPLCSLPCLCAALQCRLILQLAAIPSTADHGTIAAASELVKILSTRLPPDIAQLPNVAWTAMSAELLAELRPWLAIKADAAASGTALPAELSKQAEAVAAQVAARARLLLRPPAPAGGSDVRLAPLYRYADCDDLPAGVELADPLVSPIVGGRRIWGIVQR